MPGLASPDIQVVPIQEKVTPSKVEPKPIGQRAKEMVEKIRARIQRPNPNPDAALTEIAAVPTPEEGNTFFVLPSLEVPSNGEQMITQNTEDLLEKTHEEAQPIQEKPEADSTQQALLTPEQNGDLDLVRQEPIKRVSAEKYQEVVNRVAKNSPKVLQEILDMHDLGSSETRSALESEVEKVRRTWGITLNLDFDTLVKVLRESGRFKSRHELGRGSSGDARDEVEQLLGIKAAGTPEDPHPIYGTLTSENGSDEDWGGSSRYGDCFVKLRNERVVDRTVYAYGDSNFDMMMSNESALVAKAVNNRYGDFEYIEAEILGGVSSNDIESINLPKYRLDDPKIVEEIGRIKTDFPNISIRVIESRDIDTR